MAVKSSFKLLRLDLESRAAGLRYVVSAVPPDSPEKQARLRSVINCVK